MNCEDFLPLISAYLDGANSEAEEQLLREHLKECEHCRKLLARMQQNDILLRESKGVPPADLTEQIMREVRKEKKAVSSGKRYIFPAIASGLAAAALLGLVIWGNIPLFRYSESANKADKQAADAVPSVLSDFELIEDAESNGSLKMQETPTEAVIELTEAPTQSFTQTSAPPETTTAPTFLPEFPTFGEEAVDTPAERHNTRYTPSAPMLLIWNAESSALPSLSGFSSEELNEYSPLTANAVPSLYTHFLNAVPILKEFDQILPVDGFRVIAYTVPYETMMALFSECIGQYENAIYYPISVTAPDTCSVLLIDIDE